MLPLFSDYPATSKGKYGFIHVENWKIAIMVCCSCLYLMLFHLPLLLSPLIMASILKSPKLPLLPTSLPLLLPLRLSPVLLLLLLPKSQS